MWMIIIILHSQDLHDDSLYTIDRAEKRSSQELAVPTAKLVFFSLSCCRLRWAQSAESEGRKNGRFMLLAPSVAPPQAPGSEG